MPETKRSRFASHPYQNILRKYDELKRENEELKKAQGKTGDDKPDSHPEDLGF